MTEYITKEQAKELIRNHILGCAMLPSPEYTLDDLFHDMCWDLNHIPSADVVEVVRCKDCKYKNMESGEFDGLEPACRFWTDADAIYPVFVDMNGFCSEGELKDGGESK